MPEQERKVTMEINSETEGALYDILDSVRDKVIEQNGQVIDWEIHKDTNLEQIVNKLIKSIISTLPPNKKVLLGKIKT